LPGLLQNLPTENSKLLVGSMLQQDIGPGEWPSGNIQPRARQHLTVSGFEGRMFAYSFLVLAEGRVNDSHVEEDLGRIRDVFEVAQCLLKLIVVVPAQGRYPSLNFLDRVVSGGGTRLEGSG
jgi:hypothetical protein